MIELKDSEKPQFQEGLIYGTTYRIQQQLGELY